MKSLSQKSETLSYLGKIQLVLILLATYQVKAEQLVSATSTLAYYTRSSALTPGVTDGATFSSITVTAASASSISLAWSSNFADEQGYVIERIDANGQLKSVVVSKDSLKFTDLSVSPETYYQYRVYAFKGSVKTSSGLTAVYASSTKPLPPIISTCSVQVLSSCDRVYLIKASVGYAGNNAAFKAARYCLKAGSPSDLSQQGLCSGNVSIYDGNLSVRVASCGDSVQLSAINATNEVAKSLTYHCAEAPIPRW